MEQDQTAGAESQTELGVELPIAEWDRIGDIKLLAPDAAGFEKVQEHVRRHGKAIDAILNSGKGDLHHAVHEDTHPLRAELVLGEGKGEGADNDARVVFLYGISFLLDAYVHAYSHAPEGENAGALKRIMKQLVGDMERAAQGEAENESLNAQDYCYNCYPKYKTCMAAAGHIDSVCLNNYNTCCSTCV